MFLELLTFINLLMLKINNSITVDVETCWDCHLHAWCSQHNEQKYEEYYDKLKTRTQQSFPSAQVRHNFVPPHYKKLKGKSKAGQNQYIDTTNNSIVFFPRFGSFQISVNGNVIYSKIKSSLWPSIERIIRIIDRVVRAEDPSAYQLQYRLRNDQNLDFVKTYKAQILKRTTPKKKSFSIERAPKSSNRRLIFQRSQHSSIQNRSHMQGQLSSPRMLKEIRLGIKPGRMQFLTPPEPRQQNLYNMAFQKEKEQVNKNREPTLNIKLNKWKINNNKYPLAKKYKNRKNQNTYKNEQIIHGGKKYDRQTDYKNKNNRLYDFRQQVHRNDDLNIKIQLELHEQEIQQTKQKLQIQDIEEEIVKEVKQVKQPKQVNQFRYDKYDKQQSTKQLHGWSLKKGSSDFLACLSENSLQNQNHQHQVDQNNDSQTKHEQFHLKKKISIDDNLQMKQTFLDDYVIHNKDDTYPKQSTNHNNLDESNCNMIEQSKFEKIIIQKTKKQMVAHQNERQKEQEQSRTIKQEDIFSDVESVGKKNGKMFQTTKSQYESSLRQFSKKRTVMIWEASAVRVENDIQFVLSQNNEINQKNAAGKKNCGTMKRKIQFVESQIEEKDPLDAEAEGSQCTNRLSSSICEPIFHKARSFEDNDKKQAKQQLRDDNFFDDQSQSRNSLKLYQQKNKHQTGAGITQIEGKKMQQL